MLERIKNLDEDIDLKYHLPETETEPTSHWETDEPEKKVKDESKLNIRLTNSEGTFFCPFLSYRKIRFIYTDKEFYF